MNARARPHVRHLVTVTAVIALVGVPGAAAHAVGKGNPNGRQTICHATHSNTHPYVVNTPNKNGDVSGHAKHTGPTWNPSLKSQHQRWGDIIPSFDYVSHGTTAHFAGLNWDANGQAWFANGCRVPITGSVDKVNDANGDSTFSDDETATSAGADVAFQVTVTNTSVVPATISSVTDTVAGGAIAFTPSPDPVGTTLAAGASLTFTFTVTGYSPSDGGVLVNDLAVVLVNAADSTNHSMVQDSSTVRTAVPPPPAPDVSVVKTGPASVAPGDNLTWTLTAHNDGTVPASGVTLTDTLPTGTTLVSAGGDGWTCSGTTAVSCTLDGDLAVDASAAVTVVATLAADFADATVANTAVVTPDDATPADNTSTVTTDVTTAGGGTVTPPTTPPITGGGGGVTLPRTGAPAVSLVAYGVALVLSGLGFLFLPLGLRRRA